MFMAQPKLTMKKGDVECAIGNHVLRHYQDLSIIGREKPDTIHRVLAKIQDREYMGTGKYSVLLDVYGAVIDGDNGIKENEHYIANCSVLVTLGEDDTPSPEIMGSIIFTKQRH